MSLPSFAPIREQLAVSLHEERPRLQVHVLLLVAFIAKDITGLLRPQEYPPELIATVSELYTEEIRTFRDTWASLQEHYEALGFTQEEAEAQVYRHLYEDFL